MLQQRFDKTILGGTIALFCLPVLGEILLHGWTRVVAFFAADSFYYLTVARNFARQGFFTFDQQLPTNGFHPLWQYTLGGMYLVTNALGLPLAGVLVVTLLLCLAAISLAVLFLGKAFLLEFKQLSPTFLLLPLGVYGVLTWSLDATGGTLWSSVNGMESCLVLFGYGVLVWVMVHADFLETIGSAVATGLLLGLICLARLDHGFLAVAFFMVLGFQAVVYRKWHTLRYLLVSGVIAAATLGLYLLSNVLSVGVLVPVSGTLKSTFPHFVNDKIAVLLAMLQVPTPTPPSLALVTRLDKIVIPMLGAFVFLIWSGYLVRMRKITPLETALAVTALFVLLLGGYNLLYVPLWYQGFWYFPISILFLSLLLVYVASRWRTAPAQNSTAPRLSLAGAVGIAILAVVFFVSTYWGKEINSQYANFLVETAPLLTQYYAPEKVKLIEVDDGVLTYGTDLPAMAWLGFTLDAEGVQAKNNGDLLRLAVARGYDRIASLVYFDAAGLDPSTPSEVIQDRLGKTFFMSPKDVAGFSFHVEFVSADKHMAVIHVTPE